MQPFFLGSACDLLSLGLVDIRWENTDLDIVLPFSANTELKHVKQKFRWYYQIPDLKSHCQGLATH